jgi:hypothetical protein
MAGNPFIGRRESVGIGIETTAGTAVAPQTFSRQAALTWDQKTNTIDNVTALGRVENSSDSAVTERWTEGSLNGYVSDQLLGYLLVNLFGSVSSALHPTETTVYDNTFTVSSTALPPTLTIARTNPVASRRHAMAMLSDLEIDIKQNDWVQFTATLQSMAGTISTETVVYPTETFFHSKHVVVKTAANLAGLTGATPLQLKSLKLKMSRKIERFTPVGQIDPASFDPNEWSVTGTAVARYTDTTLEAIALANTAQAMSIALINTDTTIGTATNPSLTFTLPQVRFDPQTLDNKLAQTLSQTFNFKGELNTAAGYMIQAVATNIKNGYAHA